jgi:DNA-binding NarL/FixJ family response regulator
VYTLTIANGGIGRRGPGEVLIMTIPVRFSADSNPIATGITRIVLADAHAVVRAGIANALRERPDIAIVGEVGDGQALFRVLAEIKPDLLLTDVTMPDFELVAAIRQIRTRFPALKILVVSAYDDNAYVQGLLSAGVNGYNLKDQPLSDLRLAVERVLAGERWLCSRLVEKLVRALDAPPAMHPLTPRQRDLLRCLKEGLDNQAIARQTGLSVKTVENHLTRLYREIGVQSRLEAVTYLIQHPDTLGPDDTLQPSKEASPTRPPILIVDDNMRYRTQLHRMVAKSCASALIYEAENMPRALRLAAEVRPRLIFVDVVLGDESGIECTRALKAVVPTARIVLITAYPDREFHRIGLVAGAVALLDKKDLTAPTMREVIADMLG